MIPKSMPSGLTRRVETGFRTRSRSKVNLDQDLIQLDRIVVYRAGLASSAARKDIMADTASVPPLKFIFSARVTVHPPLDLGDVAKGARRIVPISGGDFSGPEMRGAVLPGGADWQVLRTDGVAELEARYTLRTDDGALIYVRNHALRHGPPDVIAALAAGRPVDPAHYYFRGATFFETGAAKYARLTKHVIVCTGEREPAAVKLKFFQML
jgi:hypothetical protein